MGGTMAGGSGGAAGVGGPRLRWVRWVAVLLVIAALLYAGWRIVVMDGPPTEAELREQAHLVGKTRLYIGVKDDTPGVALRDPKTGTFRGFDIQIAYLIAADLGFLPSQVEFLSIETEDRARMLARDRTGRFVKVDLVVATFSVTSDRARDPSAGFSAPYLYTEQTVLTRAGHPPVTSLTQLKGKKVCTLGTSTSESELVRAGADVTGMNEVSDCVDAVKKGRYDAASTDAAILAGFVPNAKPPLMLHDIGLEKTEMWAVNAGTNTALRTLVDLALYRSATDPRDHRWEDAYDACLRPLQATAGAQPVAEDVQPPVPEPAVRRWPWERGAGGS